MVQKYIFTRNALAIEDLALVCPAVSLGLVTKLRAQGFHLWGRDALTPALCAHKQIHCLELRLLTPNKITEHVWNSGLEALLSCWHRKKLSPREEIFLLLLIFTYH